MKRTIAFLGLLGAVAMSGPVLQNEAAADRDSVSVARAVAPAAQFGWAVSQWDEGVGSMAGSVATFFGARIGWIIGMELGGPLGAFALGGAGAAFGGF
jgi:hypothetical protein